MKAIIKIQWKLREIIIKKKINIKVSIKNIWLVKNKKNKISCWILVNNFSL
jgi:hypothetical protein